MGKKVFEIMICMEPQEENMISDNKVSIITVSYNEADTIRKTIESVLCQTFSKIEYVIVDGNSTDLTYQIVCQYDKAFQSRNISYFHISEPDQGIYDAMNKALRYCTGEWIYYLNANDSLYRDTTLEEIFSEDYGDEISCIYGNTWNIKDGKQYFKRAYKIKTISYRVPFIHQALFVRREIMNFYRFDVRYKISADYDLFARMYVNGEKYWQVDCDVAFFDLTGTSQTDIRIAYREQKEIQIKNGLYKNYRFRRFLRYNIIVALKKNPIVYKTYFCIMQLIKRPIGKQR